VVYAYRQDRLFRITAGSTMNRYLQQRLAELLAQHDTATLATCGHAGPQIGSVPYHVEEVRLYLLVPHGSDHLFNLEAQPELALLTSAWKLHGTGHITRDSLTVPVHGWQVVVQVEPLRIHVLTADGGGYIETIDFEGSEGDSQ
jgi:hypothetical protein